MLNDVYNRRILELAGTIPRIGRLESPDASATAHSKLCGSTVTIDLKMDGDTVTDFAHDVKACALGQASAALMGAHAIGASSAELAEARDALADYLAGRRDDPGGWPGLDILAAARPFAARHASILLAFQAAAAAARDAAAGSAGAEQAAG